jgi:hypothetical protein
MPENKFLVRAPLLDPKQQVVGYKLVWRGAAPVQKGWKTCAQLLDFVGERAQAAELGLLFLDAERGVTSGGIAIDTVPKNAVLMLDCADLTEDSAAGMASMRERGFRLALRGADVAFMQLHAATLLPLVTHIELVSRLPGLRAPSSPWPNISTRRRQVLVKSLTGLARVRRLHPAACGRVFSRRCAPHRGR